MVEDPASRRGRTRSTVQAYRDAQEMWSVCLSLGIYTAGGYWLDIKFGTKPLFILLGIVIGMVSAGFFLRRLLERIEKRSGKKRDSERPVENDKSE